MSLTPQTVEIYHVFLASPGEMADERQMVRRFFDEYNRTTARLWNVRFEVIDWENYSSAGVGRPQELITNATLERFRSSLALVIGIMGQRFGEPTGEFESGTEEEFNWALDNHSQTGFPEIKWFFRKVEQFNAPPEPEKILKAAEQWSKVRAFKERLQNRSEVGQQVFYREFSDSNAFMDVLRPDLSTWFADPSRPWVRRAGEAPPDISPGISYPIPRAFFQGIYDDFYRLDIAGIDNDRAFEIPLSEIYLRLRVIFDDDNKPNDEARLGESGPLDIDVALARYKQLVIVGDPGSGKSTFLKFIALILARATLEESSQIAEEALGLQHPFPVPLFLSCWDLSDYLAQLGTDAGLEHLTNFLLIKVQKYGWAVQKADLEALISSGNCILLFDGLDEVPTEVGRALVSRLLEHCVTKFGKNRYVVTSRIRAYTGDTMLRGKFVRCDVQQLTAEDRRQFLKNWFSVLLKVPLDTVEAAGTESRRNLDALSEAIEGNTRLRSLAVNPLLLTVIAIVHWNRKRLPEQRVDLYDECVDVLLGQRKEAERAARSRKANEATESSEDERIEGRSWTRKRFAEIALLTLSSSGEEVTRDDVIKVLAPRFLDQGADSAEHAEAKALRFLERQELKSGLLVSRKSHSYRFVHLTFQEYLAAWNLANQDFAKVSELIAPRLRSPRWFETLQLLGGEWAKRSDEYLDRYVSWLLGQAGKNVQEQAPVVALCANIVRDSAGTAELSAKTRKDFETAVRGTLAVFKDSSGVSETTQLEILEALGKLGPAVKEHLITATACSRFKIRCRAIEMLVPYLADNDLFGMTHIFSDRSREPVATYVHALVERDFVRAIQTIRALPELTQKAGIALMRFVYFLAQRDKASIDIISRAFILTEYAEYQQWRVSRLTNIVNLYSSQAATWSLVSKLVHESREELVQAEALRLHGQKFGSEPGTWDLALNYAGDIKRSRHVRIAAIRLLAALRGTESDAWPVICELASADKNTEVRTAAFEAIILKQHQNLEMTKIVILAASTDPLKEIRASALTCLTNVMDTVVPARDQILHSLVEDKDDDVRLTSLKCIASKSQDPKMVHALAAKAAQTDTASSVRRFAFSILTRGILPSDWNYLLLDQRVFSGRYFPDAMWRDPKEVITEKEMSSLAARRGIGPVNIKSCFELVSSRLGGLPPLEWKKDDSIVSN